jgi:hypothetical protein
MKPVGTGVNPWIVIIAVYIGDKIENSITV